MDEGTRVIFTGPQYGIDLVLENYATQMPLHSGMKSNSMVEWRARNFYQTFNKYIGHWSNGTCEWNCCKIKVQGKYRFPGIYQPVRNSHTNQSYLISTWYLMAICSNGAEGILIELWYGNVWDNGLTIYSEKGGNEPQLSIKYYYFNNHHFDIQYCV